jgi:diadenosine tetraphosphate (Ap4A) HIT family hydrolase
MNKAINIFGEEIEFNCMGCDIAEHKLIPPGGYVYEDDFINVSADPEIPIKGFMVLGINKHIKSINDMTNYERNSIISVLNKTVEIIKKVNISKKVLIIQEERSSHFHIWIVPISDWMKKFGNSVINIKEMINYSKENFNEEQKKELLKAIEDIKNEFKKNN